MIPYINSVVIQNLIKESKDETGRQETLMLDEKCQECGRELITQYSLKIQVCGICQGEKKRLASLKCRTIYGKRCELSYHDPDFNEGKGERFFRAFQRSIDRGDFKA